MDLQVIRARECSFTLLTTVLLISCINEQNTKTLTARTHVASDTLNMLPLLRKILKSDYCVFSYLILELEFHN